MGIRFEPTGERCLFCGGRIYDSGDPEEGFYCTSCMGWQIAALERCGQMWVYRHPDDSEEILALEYTDPRRSSEFE